MPLLCAGAAVMPIDVWSVVLLLRLPLFLLLLSLLLLFFVLSMVVRATDGTETLLKHALPVPRGSAEPKAKLTRPPVPLAIRQLRNFNPGPVATLIFLMDKNDRAFFRMRSYHASAFRRALGGVT